MLNHPKMDKKRFIIIFTLWSLFFIVFLLFVGKVIPYTFPHNDFYDYWIGAKLLQRGLSPYGIGEHFLAIKNSFHLSFHMATGYSYPPFTAWILYPLCFIEPHAAAWIWMISSLVLYGIVSYQFVNQYQNKWVYPFLLTFIPVIYSVASGQINIFILLFLWTWFKNPKSWIGALCFSLACVIKVYPCLLLLLFILKKQWKLVFQILLFIGIFTLLPILFYGARETVFYFAHVLPNLQNQTNGYFTYQSFISVVTRYFGAADQSLLRSTNTVFCVLVLAILITYSLVSKKSLHYLSALWIVGLSLLPGTTTFWNFTPMLFGVVILFNNWKEQMVITRYLLVMALIISNCTWHSTFWFFYTKICSVRYLIRF